MDAGTRGGWDEAWGVDQQFWELCGSSHFNRAGRKGGEK